MCRSATNPHDTYDPLMTRWIGAALLALAILVGGLLLSILVPRNAPTDATRSPVLVATQTIPPLERQRTGVLELGDPPTRAWPTTPECPASLELVCGGKRLALIGTVNLPRESVVTGAFAPETRLAVCEWPVERGVCDIVGDTGATVAGESAVYALP